MGNDIETSKLFCLLCFSTVKELKYKGNHILWITFIIDLIFNNRVIISFYNKSERK
jgi:hypothetical protein